MKEELTISKGTLSETDLDILSGMMIVFLRAAEKCMQMIELHYEAEYRAGNEYKQYCKLYGKAYVDSVLAAKVQKIIRGDERNKLGQLLKRAKDFHTAMDTLVDSGMKAHNDHCTDVQAFDAIMHDSNFLCYLYALTGNCNGKDDELKILSTIKAFAKDGRVSDNLLNKLNYTQL